MRWALAVLMLTGNPYCDASAEELVQRFEQKVLTMASWWTARTTLREEARLFFECWVAVREAVTTEKRPEPDIQVWTPTNGQQDR